MSSRTDFVGGGAGGDDVSEALRAAARAEPPDHLGDLADADQAHALRAADGGAERTAFEGGSEVEEGARRRRDRDLLRHRPVSQREAASPVRSNSPVSAPAIADHEHVRRSPLLVLEESPQGGGREVACHGIRTAGLHGGK